MDDLTIFEIIGIILIVTIMITFSGFIYLFKNKNTFTFFGIKNKVMKSGNDCYGLIILLWNSAVIPRSSIQE